MMILLSLAPQVLTCRLPIVGLSLSGDSSSETLIRSIGIHAPAVPSEQHPRWRFGEDGAGKFDGVCFSKIDDSYDFAMAGPLDITSSSVSPLGHTDSLQCTATHCWKRLRLAIDTGLAVGSSAIATFKAWAATSGSRDCGAVVDSSNSVIESNEDNNTFTSATQLQVPPITVVYPNGGERLDAGDVVTIASASSGLQDGYIDVVYSAHWFNWANIVLVGLSTTCQWTVSSVSSTNCYILVGNPSSNRWLSRDQSDRSFAVMP